MPLEHIETELKDIGTHMSQQDRRMLALEAAVAALEASRLEDSTGGTGAPTRPADGMPQRAVSSPPGQGGHTDRTPKRSFLGSTPSGGIIPGRSGEKIPLLDPPGVFTKPEEALEYAAKVSLTEVADLKLKVEGARKAILANKRVAEAMADERDEARDKLEKITDAIQEAKLDDTLVSGGSVIHYIETAIGE